jgi:hypothetical protein
MIEAGGFAFESRFRVRRGAFRQRRRVQPHAVRRAAGGTIGVAAARQ